jgi:hypothetical protein
VPCSEGDYSVVLLYFSNVSILSHEHLRMMKDVSTMNAVKHNDEDIHF